MTIAEFNNQFEHFLQALIERVKVKQQEYGRNDNPFHNFDTDARFNKTLPELSLHGYMSKQLVSYFDIIDDIRKGLSVDIKLVDEKFGDIIVYLGILRTMINQKNYEQGNNKSDEDSSQFL